MSATDTEQTLETAAVAPPPTEYETCEQCHAPVEANQRYCVMCGTRRRHVYDPAARFLSDASSRSRSAARVARGPVAPKRRSPGLALALVLAAIPLAVAAGVLIGGRGRRLEHQAAGGAPGAEAHGRERERRRDGQPGDRKRRRAPAPAARRRPVAR